MSLLDSLDTLRKSPTPVKQRFVATVTLVSMAVAASVWFAFFLWNISHLDLSFDAPLEPPYSE